jgi:serine/threonine-protein kinase
MSENDRVLRLVGEALDSGRTPEEVCADWPELLAEVRERWEECRRLSGEIDALFPAADDPADVGLGLDIGIDPAALARYRTNQVPQIPGYEVGAVLGRGGMGVVYRARHLGLNRAVALKMLLSGAYASPVELARFLREARAVAGLRHPNVVQVYDVGEFDGRAFYTMELVEGGTLAERLANTPQPAAEAAAMLVTLAGAVEAAHRGGIVHRDLKPSNVLLTPEGVPKISDFGLARSSRGDDALTAANAAPGTPCYMAPEQAAGSAGPPGPAGDVYSLGVILYEMLTGRPPFRGESAAETRRQLLADDPVPPRRLNPRVPRDLETICLKCLQRAPARRYGSAAALAEDLGRFQRGEPIAARAVGRAERAAKWVRRRPAVASLWAVGVVVAAAVAGGTQRWAAARAEDVRAVGGHLREAARLHGEARWAEARAAIDRAEEKLGGRRLGDLRERIDRARRDAALAARIDDIRVNRAMAAPVVSRSAGPSTEPSQERPEGPEEWYEALFRAAGFFDDGMDARAVAARVRASPVRRAVTAAVYDWLSCTTGAKRDRLVWLMGVARESDVSPDPDAWRARALDPATWGNPAAVAALAAEPAAEKQPADVLVAFGDGLLMIPGQDALGFLLRVQPAHPGHYGLNHNLSRRFSAAGNLPEAIRFAQAAVAVRPDAAMARFDLGVALRAAGRLDDAIVQFEEAVRLRPEFNRAWMQLSSALVAAGRHAEAVRAFGGALETDPADVKERIDFAGCLEALGRLDEAVREYREAIRRYREWDAKMSRVPAEVGLPSFSELRQSYARGEDRLRAVLVRLGRADEVLAEWRAAVDATGPLTDRAWSGYAECALFAGRADEYRRACGVLLDRAAATNDPRVWEVVGRAALLSPPPEADLRRATALIDRAVAADASRPGGYGAYFRAAKGLAELRGGRYEAAVAILEGDAAGVHGPMPKLVVAMCRARQGRAAEARRALARAVVSFDWGPMGAVGADAMMYHVLRREAEAAVLPGLSAFLAGRDGPREADERLAMTGVCQFMELHAAHARLWADAYASDPALAVGGRGHAVRAAVLAGCGLGRDAGGLTEAERSGLRARARQWMRDELVAAQLALDRGAAVQPLRTATLRAWLTSPDLAGVRVRSALEKLPGAERAEWAALWSQVGAVAKRAGAVR